MNNWEANAHKNILALSDSLQFDVALAEWQFTGEVADFKIRCLCCQMCEHEKLRYQFIIQHKNNGLRLGVGSSCILKFGNIKVVDNHGREITNERMRKSVLESAIDSKNKEIMLGSLRQLWIKQTNSRVFIAKQVKHYKKTGAFYPKSLVSLFRSMDKWHIDYDPKLYVVNLRREQYKDDVLTMSHSEYKILGKALTLSQSKRINLIRGSRSA